MIRGFVILLVCALPLTACGVDGAPQAPTYTN